MQRSAKALSTNLLGSTSRDLLIAFYLGKGKCVRNIGVFLSVQLNVRINKIIQTLAVLPGLKLDVASDRELHPVYIMRAKEVVALFLMLPGFRDIDWYPSPIVGIELGPAVVTGNFALAVVIGKGKTDFKTARNVL